MGILLCSGEFCAINSLLSTFTPSQNASAELRTKYQMKFSRENKP